MRNWKLGVLLAAVLIFALTPAAMWGQNVYGTIAGTVTDSSGAAIGNTTVTLTNLDKNEKHDMVADASGNYSFVNILPGRYKIEAEKSGFKKFVREPINVEIESGLKVDITLQVGAQTETVEVTGAPPLLQPETNSGASHRTTICHGYAAKRAQPASPGAISAGRSAAGPALSGELLDEQPGRRESFRSWRFSGWRRHGWSKPDFDRRCAYQWRVPECSHRYPDARRHPGIQGPDQ